MGRIRPRRRARIDAVSLDDAPEKSGVAKYMDVIRAIKGTLPLVDPLVKGIRKAIAKPPTSPRAAAAQRSLEDGLTPEQSAELINMQNLERKRAAAAAAQPMSGPGLPQTGILPGTQFFAPQKDSKPVVPLGGKPFPRMGFQKSETRSSVTPGTLIGEGLGGPFQYPQFTDSKTVRTRVQPGLSSIKPPALSLDPRLTPMLNVPGEDPATRRRLSDAQRAGIASVLRGRGVDVPANIPGVGRVSDQDIRESLGPLESVSDEDIATLRMQGRVAGPAKVPSIPETKLESPFLRPEPADLPERPSDMPAITPTVVPVPEGARLGQAPGTPMPTMPTEVGGVKVPMKDGRIDIAQLGKMFREKNVTDRKAARGDSALPEDLSQYSLTELRAIRKLAKTPADIRRLGAAARARGEYEMPPGLLGTIAGESGARAGEQYVLRELPAPMTESQRRLALLKVRKLLAEGRNIEAQAALRRIQAAEKAENIPLLRSKTQLNSARAWDIMRKAMRKRGRGRKRLPGLPDGTEIKVLPPKSPGNPTSISRRIVVFSPGATPEQRKNPETLSKMSKIQGKINTITDKQFEDAVRKEGKAATDLLKFFVGFAGKGKGNSGNSGNGNGTGRDSTHPNEGKKKG